MIINHCLEPFVIASDFLLFAFNMVFQIYAQLFQRRKMAVKFRLTQLFFLQWWDQNIFELGSGFFQSAYIVVGVLLLKNALGTDVFSLTVEAIVDQLLTMLRAYSSLGFRMLRYFRFFAPLLFLWFQFLLGLFLLSGCIEELNCLFV